MNLTSDRLPTDAYEVGALSFEVTDNYGSNGVRPCGAYGPWYVCRASSPWCQHADRSFGLFGLVQSVRAPTHRRGHIIDWFVHRADQSVIKSLVINETLPSDHFCLLAHLHLFRPLPQKCYVQASNFTAVDKAVFNNDLSTRLALAPPSSADGLRQTLTDLLNQHAPASTHLVSHHPPSPWFSLVGPQLLEAKRERRRAERQWIKSGLTVHKLIFQTANSAVHAIVHSAKTAYYNTKILACSTSNTLWPIWRSTALSLRNKIRIFNTNVKSVLLYSSETWRVTKTNTHKLQTFTNRCLRTILNIRWPEVVSNVQLWDKTKQTPIETEIRKRKWGWIGHTLRKPASNITRQAFDWNPQGKRKVGRPKHTWWRSTDAEIKAAGTTWAKLKRTSQNRVRWRGVVAALCSTKNQEA